MPSGAAPRSSSRGKPADVVLGDFFGTACAPDVTDTARKALQSVGFQVACNKPYAGGFITEHYGRPLKGLHALQIEVNRGLYMDERTIIRKPSFPLLQDDIARFVSQLMSLPDSCFFDYSIAAE